MENRETGAFVSGCLEPKERPELDELIERARNHKMTPAERFEQRVSFVMTSGTNLSREAVRDLLVEDYGDPVAHERDKAKLAKAREALRCISERATELRMGTDDWFELVEFEQCARAALKELADE